MTHVHDQWQCPAHVPGCSCPDRGDSICNPYRVTGYCPDDLDVMPARRCATCRGLGWTCEGHPGRPWGDLCCEPPRRAALVSASHRLLPYRGLFRLAWRIRVLCVHGACHCGAPGDACTDCNPGGHVNWVTVITEAGP